MASIRNWKQSSGIEIHEVEYDGDRHAFEMYVNGNHVVTFYADTPGQSMDMRTGLDAGEDVRDWEDIDGNSVEALIRQRTGAGLRETLRRLEEEGMRYTTFQLSNNGDGIVWIDEVSAVNDIYYEYETEDLDLGVDDLTGKELKDVKIWGL